MSKEQQELVGDAYKSYENKYYKGEAFGHKKLNDSEYSPDLKLSQEEFIDKCKTNPDFSEKWGLKIEERELNDDELNIANLFKQTSTKLITIAYNDKTIESYE